MDDFGSMSTGSNTGWAHMRSGEFVVNEQPAAEHAGALEAIRSGASHADMASYYGGGSTVRPEQPHESWSGDIHIHAMDTQTGVQWLLNNKHAVRSAVSASYAENSGGADA
jgi:hypothetical protein